MTPLTLKNRFERRLVVFATVTILRCLVYSDTVSVPFAFDDVLSIENPFAVERSLPAERTALRFMRLT